MSQCLSRPLVQVLGDMRSCEIARRIEELLDSRLLFFVSLFLSQTMSQEVVSSDS
jgi:hypothetical protein